MSTKNKNKRVYKLGVRIALYTSLISSLVTFLILIAFRHPINESLFLAGLVLTFTFVTSYFVGYNLEFKRIQVLERVSKNISK